MNQKTYRAKIELDEEVASGSFKAVFSTFDVEDLDGDITQPTAFKRQATIIEPWNHGHSLPVGVGRVDFDEKEAWVEGNFFLDTEQGRDHYSTVKNMGPVAEWSYTFNILDAEEREDSKRGLILKELDVVGVSPVTRGAGIATRTTDIKQRNDHQESSKSPGDHDDRDDQNAQEMDDVEDEAQTGKLSGIGLESWDEVLIPLHDLEMEAIQLGVQLED